MEPLSPEEQKLNELTKALESLLADRTRLAQCSKESRKRLMMAAGRLSHPHREEIKQVSREHRKIERKKKQSQDLSLLSKAKIRQTRSLEVFIAPPKIDSLPTSLETLSKARYCYICKESYTKVHFFYDAMCERCAHINYEKRFPKADLKNRMALITGARLKIGYQASLMLLRSGAQVIVTTRFPKDAAKRYAGEKDFSDWGHRLSIFGLDLRHIPSVESFCSFIRKNYSRLDFLINNAAQTVRRPPGFYRHLMKSENIPTEQLAKPHRKLLQLNSDWLESYEKPSFPMGENAAIGSALEIHTKENTLFPEGVLDADCQQMDLRQMNSWRMLLADVSTHELIEVQLINSIAPFVLCRDLKPLMLQSPTWDRQIVNVSAMEGKFSRGTKTEKHPHTNMAKAALNMMTLTSASDFARDGIYMNAVDTGWVTDEDPFHLSQRKKDRHGFEPPLDIVDGAARVVDPIFSAVNLGSRVYGKFLKDFSPTDW